MVVVILLVLSTCVISAITWWYYEYIKNEKYLVKYRGPKPIVLLGNVLDLGDVKVIVQNVLKMRDRFGDVLKIWIGSRPRLLICGEQMAEAVLGSQKLIEKAYEYNFFHSWLGTGLLTSTGSKWRQRRRLLTPAFHFQILEQYLEIFDLQGNILVENLQKEVGKSPFDIFPYITLYALDVICEAAMGTSVNAQNDSESEYVRSVKEICRIIFDRGISPLKASDLLFALSRDYWKQKKALRVLHGYTDAVIVGRRNELLAATESGGELHVADDAGIKKRMAFLDILLRSDNDGTPLSNADIREEVDTFMFEGHDTTTSGISFALYSLSKHPDIQEKVVEELQKIFEDDKTRSATYQDLQDMKYLEMVIKESLRLYPPVPLFSRVLNSDSTIVNEVLPKGLTLTVFILGLHTNPDLFPNPTVFDPDRFLPENTSGRSPYAYTPFSAGPRNCIGQRFAMLEMKSTISKLLRQFQLLPVEDHSPRIMPDVILKSANGLPILLRKRNF